MGRKGDIPMKRAEHIHAANRRPSSAGAFHLRRAPTSGSIVSEARLSDFVHVLWFSAERAPNGSCQLIQVERLFHWQVYRTMLAR